MAVEQKATGSHPASEILSGLGITTPTVKDEEWAEKIAGGIRAHKDSYSAKNLQRARHLELVARGIKAHDHIGAWSEMDEKAQKQFEQAVAKAKAAL